MLKYIKTLRNAFLTKDNTSHILIIKCGMLISTYDTIDYHFKAWVIGYDFFVSPLKKYKAKDKIKAKVTTGGILLFFETENSTIESLVWSNRLQFLFMYTDTLSKQCDEKL